MGDSTERFLSEPVASVESLEGAALDAAVANASGMPFKVVHYKEQDEPWCVVASEHRAVGPLRREGDYDRLFRPSTEWDDGGPIIERELINISHEGDDLGDCCWLACIGWDGGFVPSIARAGPTPLIAAMRAYVAKRASENRAETLETDSKRG